MWADYVTAQPQFADEQPTVEPFGDSPELANELIDLVVAGRKRATAGAVQFGVPEVGAHWVMTDGAGEPRAIVRTTEIRVGRLDSVDDQFAWDEGEGDRSRDYWLDAHRTYFRRVIPELDDVDALETVFERFTVVWPPELADS